ncbi:hypothetical protein GCM10009555_088480 [Acrocarpospora macrocephala]
MISWRLTGLALAGLALPELALAELTLAELTLAELTLAELTLAELTLAELAGLRPGRLNLAGLWGLATVRAFLWGTFLCRGGPLCFDGSFVVGDDLVDSGGSAAAVPQELGGDHGRCTGRCQRGLDHAAGRRWVFCGGDCLVGGARVLGLGWRERGPAGLV